MEKWLFLKAGKAKEQPFFVMFSKLSRKI